MKQQKFKVECESTNVSAGPNSSRIKLHDATISEKGIVVRGQKILKDGTIVSPLRGTFFTIRVLHGADRFIAPAQVIGFEKDRTRLAWMHLLDSDRDELEELLGESH